MNTSSRVRFPPDRDSSPRLCVVCLDPGPTSGNVPKASSFAVLEISKLSLYEGSVPFKVPGVRTESTSPETWAAKLVVLCSSLRRHCCLDPGVLGTPGPPWIILGATQPPS